MSVINDFSNADAAGKGMSIVPFYSPFSDCGTSGCTPYVFPAGAMANIRNYGAIPMLSWGSSSIQDASSTSSPTDPGFTLADVANGNFDAYITSFAQAAKAWGHPFFLRFDWEMNGNWFVWGTGTNGNTAAQYVAAWRHVWNIFSSVGATNATWVWCPNNGDQNGSLASIASLYPGDQYVNWTCFDAYNQGGQNWQTWDQVARSTYDTIASVASTKPMMVGETGSVSTGGSRGLWLTQMLAELPTSYPKIRALVYFDQWSDALEPDPSSQTAFASGIANPAYAGNGYATLPGTGPITAP